MLTILTGDAIQQLRTLPDESVQCCVTSPPYWGLRDYGTNGQLGLEKTPEEYVAKMVEIFREVRRVLRKDGTLWLNLGDSYWGGGNGPAGNFGVSDETRPNNSKGKTYPKHDALKPKDLCGIPWRVAFALQADGWWLRSDIIWAKPNPMPESVTDRPTKAHEYLFLLTKSANYFYDAEAIKEPQTEGTLFRFGNGKAPRKPGIKEGGSDRKTHAFDAATPLAILEGGRNKRSVWTVATAPYPEAHFATYPPDLIKPCIMAGTKCGDVILDPFAGSGTTGAVALELGRKAVLIELNPKYVALIRQRCDITPGLQLA